MKLVTTKQILNEAIQNYVINLVRSTLVWILGYMFFLTMFLKTGSASAFSLLLQITIRQISEKTDCIISFPQVVIYLLR